MKVEHISMQGGGYYNENCTLQRMAIDKSLSLFAPIVPGGDSIVLADYGSSEGDNTISLLQRHLEQLPSISSATLVFNDTPSNDFSSLSSTIDANRSTLSQNGKLKINPLMVPTSYFQKVLPDNFVDAAFSFTALHWLQHTPTHSNDHCGQSGSAASALSDLVAFLSARHRELRYSGTLTLGVPCAGPVNVTPAVQCLEAVVSELSSAYEFSPSVITSLPLYFRTMDEILSALKVCTGAWNVLGKHTVPIEHPAWPWNGTPKADSNEDYANGVTGFTMAATSRFLIEDVKANADNQYPGDAEFLEECRVAFKREFLRSHQHEKVGFTYAFLHVQKA